jgi:hypothetical protein
VRYVSQYIAAIWADWLSRMSSVASLVFTAIGLSFRLTELGHARYWLAAAFVSYVIASFRVWYKTRPDLHIEKAAVFLDTGGAPEQLIPLNVPTYATFMLSLVNRHPATTSIVDYHLLVNMHSEAWLVGETMRVRGFKLDNRGEQLDLDVCKGMPMPQGSLISGWVRFAFNTDVRERRFKLTVTDAYGVAHHIDGTLPPHFSKRVQFTYANPEASQSPQIDQS